MNIVKKCYSTGKRVTKQLVRKSGAYICFLIAICIHSVHLHSQPDFNRARLVHRVRIYHDSKISNLYYFEPGAIKIACDSEGKPDFTFLSTRYTGTRLGSDQATSRFSNIIRFRLVMEQPSRDIIHKLKSTIKDRHNSVNLQPLPIKYFKTHLVYQSVIPGNSATTNQLPEGCISSLDENGYSSQSCYWREREYSLRLDNYTSQIFRELLRDGIVLSVGYAFYADFIDTLNSDIHIDGVPEFVKSMQEDFGQQPDSTENDSAVVTKLIKADAFNISIDINEWPDFIKQIDIGQFSIPPDYAAMDVYCFDFNNELRADLYAKRVEIEAIGVGRGNVSVNATFRSSQPDLYTHNVRFPYAVRVDRPFRYRIVEIPHEGRIKTSPWKEKKMWSEILDITTIPE